MTAVTGKSRDFLKSSIDHKELKLISGVDKFVRKKNS